MIHDGLHIKLVPDIFVRVCMYVCVYMYVYVGSDRGIMQQRGKSTRLGARRLGSGSDLLHTGLHFSLCKMGVSLTGPLRGSSGTMYENKVKTEDAVHERGRAALLLLNSIISLHSKHQKKTHSALGLSKGLP